MNEEENEKKVLNNAVNNYTNKRAEFLQLVDFLNETGSDNFRYLTFLKNDRISCTVFADSNYAENLRNNIPTSIAMVPDFQGITLLPDNRAKIMYADTFIVLSDWTWDFEGGVHDIGYDFVLSFLKLDRQQLSTFKSLLKKINCESISVQKNQKTELLFDGVDHYKVEYVLSENFNYETFRYLKIDTNTFCGVFKYQHYFGRGRWKKLRMPK